MGVPGFCVVFCCLFALCQGDLCSRDWSEYNGECYRLFRIKSRWDDSEKHCQDSENAQLAVARDAEENEFLGELVRNSNEQYAWFGLYRYDNQYDRQKGADLSSTVRRKYWAYSDNTP